MYDPDILYGIPVFWMRDQELSDSHSDHRWISGGIPLYGIKNGGRCRKAVETDPGKNKNLPGDVSLHRAHACDDPLTGGTNEHLCRL